MKIGFDIAREARELFVGGDAAFRSFALLQDLLSLFLILPEIRGAGLLLKGG